MINFKGMMCKVKAIFVIGLMIFIGACSFPEQEISVFSISYLFKDSDEGWTGDFADYPEGDSIAYELFYKHDTLPTNLNNNATLKALHISGNNGSDDLFMFVKKKITGLKANTSYVLLFNVKVASNAPTGAVGIGGAPGESVFVKAGASVTEPKKMLQAGMYRMNIDKGNQSEEGADMINIGNVGVAPNTSAFTVITRNNNSSNGFLITTDSSGEIWLVIGTDSGFEGPTTLYYTQVDVLFNQLN
ncbi:MAG: hypothetical protein WAZ98_11775 [Cyclobacteriaceae bacterium]